MSLIDIAEVDIDAKGRFKYILIRLKSISGEEKLILRGYEWAGYHGSFSLSCNFFVLFILYLFIFCAI